MFLLPGILPFAHLDDDAFFFALYEQQHGSIRFDEDRLSYLHFNPLIVNVNKQLALSDIDPDLNSHATTNLNCKYYVEDSFNEMLISSLIAIYAISHFYI